jgi:predicted TIM-barrel fold metal-dependent hydrolase
MEPDMTYFDACCVLGRSLRTGPQHPCTVPQLLEEMDHFGIHEALVLDSMSVSTNPMAGNARILDVTRDQPRLHPAWALLLPSSREFPPPEEIVAQMREAGVGAVWLFYKHFLLPLDEWAADELLEPLAQARVPLFLSPDSNMEGYSDRTDWSEVVALCKRHPDLPVIVSENRIYRSQRALYEALNACPNLRLDLSSVWLHHRIEFICREWGAQRLVWASHLPDRTPGTPLMQLNYSDISEDELALIAGGNLRQMLSWNPHLTCVDDVPFPEPIDTLHRKVRRRESLREEKFADCHGHIGWADPYHVVNDTPAELVADMDKFGLDVNCVFGMQIMGDNDFSNDEVAAMLQAYPGRFVGFTFVNPNYGEAAMLAELERGLTLGMQGIKLMLSSYNTYPVDGPLVDVPCRFAHEHGQIILSHTWGSADRIRDLCTRFPAACFIAGHATSAFVEVCQEVENLFICTCPFLAWNQTEEYVRMYGADRILFGSDLTDLPISWGLGQIMYARIAEEDKRKILGENLRRIMAKYGVIRAAVAHDRT